MGKYFESSNKSAFRVSEGAKARKRNEENNSLSNRTNSWLKNSASYFDVGTDKDEYTTEYFKSRGARATELRKQGQSLLKEIESSSEFDTETKNQFKSYLEQADLGFAEAENRYSQNPYTIKYLGTDIHTINDKTKDLLKNSGPTELFGMTSYGVPEGVKSAVKKSDTVKELEGLAESKLFFAMNEGGIDDLSGDSIRKDAIQRLSAGLDNSPYYGNVTDMPEKEKPKAEDKNSATASALKWHNDNLPLRLDKKKPEQAVNSLLDANEDNKVNIKDVTEMQKKGYYTSLGEVYLENVTPYLTNESNDYAHLNNAYELAEGEYKTELSRRVGKALDSAGYKTVEEVVDAVQSGKLDWGFTRSDSWNSAGVTDYFNSIQDVLTQNSAKRTFEKFKGNTVGEIAYNFVAAMDETPKSMGKLFTGDTRVTKDEALKGYISEDLDDEGFKLPEVLGGQSIGRVMGDLASTTGRQFPYVLAGTVASSVAGAGPTGQKVSQVLSSGFMGLAAAGDAKVELLRQGYSDEQATGYGILVGASEATLQYLLGGISSMGGKLTKNFAKKLVGKVNNALARVAINTGTQLLGEFTEESLQEVLAPVFKRMVGVSEQDIDDPSFGDVMYAGILGALSAGTFETGGIVSSEINTQRTGKAVKGSSAAVEKLKRLGSVVSADSVAYKLAGKINEKSSAYQIGRAFYELGAELSEQEISTLTEKLTDKGVAKADAQTLVSALQATMQGEELNEAQKAVLENNTVLTETVQDLYGKAQNYNAITQLANEAVRVAEAEKTINKNTKAADAQSRIVAKAENALLKKYADLAEVKANAEAEGSTQTFEEALVADERYSSDEKFKAMADSYIDNQKVYQQDTRDLAIDQMLHSLHKDSLKTEEEQNDIRKADNIKVREAKAKAKAEKANLKVSEKNTTQLVSTGEYVSIQRVLDNGMLSVKHKDGTVSQVSKEAVAFESEGMATAYAVISDMAVPSQYMTNLTRNIMLNSDASVGAQAEAMVEAFGYGEIGLTVDKVKTMGVSDVLTESQIKFAVEMGQQNATRNTQRAEREVQAKKEKSLEDMRAEIKHNHSKGKKGKFKHDFSKADIAAMKKQNPDKYNNFKTAEGISQLLAVDIQLIDTSNTKYQSYKNIGADGVYINGTVYLDINANWQGNENTFLEVLSHELTHYIRDWSPAKFKALADFVVNEFADNNVDVEALIDEQLVELSKLDDYKDKTASELRDIAFEEVVARACERMLVDSNAVQKLAELKKRDSSLFNRIKSFVQRFIKDIKSRFAKMNPHSEEAKAVKSIVGMTEELAKLFEDAVVTATENQRIAGEKDSSNVAKFKKTRYNEFNTLAMQWRYNAATKVGDAKIIHKNLNTAVLLEATEDGYIEIKSGKYREVAKLYERAYREATVPIYEHFNSYGADKGRGDWDSFDDGNRGVSDSGAGSSTSKGVQNITPGDTKYNRQSDKGISGETEGLTSDIKFHRKSLDALSDAELLARHLEENSEAVGEILSRTADIEINPRVLNLLVNKKLKEYGISKEGRESVANIVPLLLDSAKIAAVKGGDITADLTSAIADAVRNTNYTENLHAEDRAEVVEALKGFKGRIYLNEGQAQHLLNNGYTFQSFRQSLFGKLNVVKESANSKTSETPFTEVYLHLSEQFPNLFVTRDSMYSDKSVDESEYALDLIEKLESLSEEHQMRIEDVFGADASEVATHIMSELVADVVQKKYSSRKNPYVADVVEKLRTQRDKAVKKTREKAKESRQKAREKHKTTEMRNKVRKLEAELRRMLTNPTQTKYVPAELVESVVDVLSVVNMDTQDAEARVAKYDKLIEEANAKGDYTKAEELIITRENIKAQGEKLTQKLNDIAVQYAKLKSINGDRTIYEPHIEEMILGLSEVVGDTPIRLMSIEQLTEVYDAFNDLKSTITNANRMFADNQKASVESTAIASNDEFKETASKSGYVAFVKKKLGKMGFMAQKPVYFFRTLGSKTFYSLYDNIRKAQGVWYRDVFEARDKALELKEKYKFNSWDNKKSYTFVAKNGGKVTLNLGSIMTIYALSRREQARPHIIEGGILLGENVKAKSIKGEIQSYDVNMSAAFNLSEESLSKIIDTLTEEQKHFVEDMQEYLSKDMAEKGNEVYLTLYGRKKFVEPYYFPIEVAEDFLNFKPEEVGETKIKNASHTKDTQKNANSPVVINDFMEVWSGHVNKMSLYHAFTLPVEDFSKVYNYKTAVDKTEGKSSIKSTLTNTYPGANEYITNFLKDLNGGVRSNQGAEWVNKLVGMTKKNAVFLSLSVAIQQPSAIVRSMAHVAPMHFFSAVTDLKNMTPKAHNREWQECKKWAPVAGIKEMGYFDTGMGSSSAEWIAGNEYKGIKDKSKALVTDKNYRGEVMTWLPAKMDELTWTLLWRATKKEIAHRTGLSMTDEKLLAMAGERFEEVVELTQVYDSVVSRSGLMRSKDTAVKMATSFMSEPTVQYNMLFDAALQGKRNGKAGKIYQSKVALAWAASVVVNAALKSLVTAMRDDDEDETYWEKYLTSLTANTFDGLLIFNSIPFVRDIMSILNGYDVERMDMAPIAEMVDSINAVKSDGTDVWEIVDVGCSILGFLGVPAKNLVRDVKGVINTVSSAFEAPEATKQGALNAFREGLPFAESVEKQKDIYRALVRNDTKHQERIAATYKTPDAYEKALKQSIREYHKPLREAVRNLNESDLASVEAEAKAIADKLGLDVGVVKEAMKSEAKYFNNKVADLAVLFAERETDAEAKKDYTVKMKEFVERYKGIYTYDELFEMVKNYDFAEDTDKETDTNKKAVSTFSASDMNRAFDSGKFSDAMTALNDLVKTRTENNMQKVGTKKENGDLYTAEDAEKNAKSTTKGNITSEWKPKYQTALENNDYNEIARIERILTESGLYEDVGDTLEDWKP